MTVVEPESQDAVIPDQQKLLFLQCCVGQDKTLSSRWVSWLSSIDDPIAWISQEGRQLSGHLALLYRNLGQHQIEIPESVRPYLRAAVFRGKRRWALCKHSLDDTVDVFAGAGKQITLLKGFALSITAYSIEPYLRHCHDIDVLVSRADVEPIIAELESRKYIFRWSMGSTTRIDHSVGIPILLHTQLLNRSIPNLITDGIALRCRTLVTRAGSVRLLSVPDMLLHIIAHSLVSDRRAHYNWVIDACTLARRMTEQDWLTFFRTAEDAGLLQPVSASLEFLINHFKVIIPSAFR